MELGMPDNDDASTRVNGENGPSEAHLIIKQRLSELLFVDLSDPTTNDPADHCRLLSFDPGSRRNPKDKLTSDRKNADIFTSQSWAVLKAWQVFGKIVENIDEFQGLQIKIKKSKYDSEPKVVEEKPEYDRFVLAIVGSSVTGLSFHATLRYLFDNSRLKHDYEFDDLFEIKYVDSHQTPLQRLFQARDRRIIPRFEYERILDLDSPVDVTVSLYPQGSDELVNAWNDTSQIDAYPKALAALEKLRAFETVPKFMPAELCWQAGNVREVAQRLLEGFNKITKNYKFDGIPGDLQGSSSTGGPVYVGSKSLEALDENAQKTSRLGIVVFPERQKTATAIGANYRLKSDFVLLATGPGVDIPPDRQHPTDVDPDTHYLLNSQSSYWNTPKMELDVVESEGKQVLVLGNGDSAAGAVFSTLFKDAEACTHRFLNAILEHSGYREWFTEVRKAVIEYNSDGTMTERWNKALESNKVLNILYRAPYDKEFLDQFLRVPVSVSIGLRLEKNKDEKDNEVKFASLKANETAPPFMSFEKDHRGKNYLPILRQRLFHDAWPENRIIIAVLFNQLMFYQFNTDEERDLIKHFHQEERTILQLTGDTAPKTRLLEFAVPLFTVNTYELDLDENVKQTPLYFKYVMDCRGRKFFSLSGNMIKQHCREKKNKAEATQSEST